MTEQTARANLDAAKRELRFKFESQLACVRIANTPPADLDILLPDLLAALGGGRENRDALARILQDRATP